MAPTRLGEGNERGLCGDGGVADSVTVTGVDAAFVTRRLVTDIRLVVAGMVVAVLAVPAGLTLAHWSRLQQSSVAFGGMVDDRGGVWRLLRGTLAYGALPFLLLLAAVLVVVTFRRSRRDGLVLGGAMLAGNVTVQLIKHPPMWKHSPLLALDPLSGHVGVATAVALGLILVARRARQPTAAIAALAVISMTGVGVILAGWHSLAQVACPFLVVLGWTIIATGFLSQGRHTGARGSWKTLTVAGIAGIAGSGLAISFLVLIVEGPVPTQSTLASASVFVACAVVGLASVGVAATVVCLNSTTATAPTAGLEIRGVGKPTQADGREWRELSASGGSGVRKKRSGADDRSTFC
jgi:hypothetical protein